MVANIMPPAGADSLDTKLLFFTEGKRQPLRQNLESGDFCVLDSELCRSRLWTIWQSRGNRRAPGAPAGQFRASSHDDRRIG